MPNCSSLDEKLVGSLRNKKKKQVKIGVQKKYHQQISPSILSNWLILQGIISQVILQYNNIERNNLAKINTAIGNTKYYSRSNDLLFINIAISSKGISECTRLGEKS